MQTGMPSIYYVVAAIVVVAVLFAIVASRRSKSAHLQRRFGPEYDRAVQTSGDRPSAERELAAREARTRKFHLVELPRGARDRYRDEWEALQARFVDEPRPAVNSADNLVSNVMRDKGYPMENFEQRAADISPDHPGVVENYRAAHDIASRSGEVSTEDLRQAMVHYRTLFGDLLGTDERTTS